MAEFRIKDDDKAAKKSDKPSLLSHMLKLLQMMSLVKIFYALFKRRLIMRKKTA